MDYDLRLGETITLQIEGRSCASNLQEITPNGTMILSAPTFRSAVVPVRAGNQVTLIYYRTSGMYSCTVEVTRRLTENENPFVEVELRSPVTKYQRREFVRFDTMLPVEMRELVPAKTVKRISPKEAVRSVAERVEYDDPAAPDPILGETLDLSGGGARISSTAAFEPDTLVECVIALRDDTSATADALVLHCEETDSKRYPFRMKVGFAGIKEEHRKRIIRYIFEEQIKRRQTGE